MPQVLPIFAATYRYFVRMLQAGISPPTVSDTGITIEMDFRNPKLGLEVDFRNPRQAIKMDFQKLTKVVP